jgi:hypothetical protein
MIINKDTVTKIQIFDFYEVWQYTYIEAPTKCWLGWEFGGRWTLRKPHMPAGVYCLIYGECSYVSEGELEKEYLVLKDRKVYERPKAVLHFPDGSKQSIYFNSEKGAILYVRSHFDHYNLLEI